MSQDNRLLISINNKEILVKMKKMRGFCSKTIEIMFEHLFSKTTIEELWSKYYFEGVDAYRTYIIKLMGQGNQNDPESKVYGLSSGEKSKNKTLKKKTKIETSMFWQ